MISRIYNLNKLVKPKRVLIIYGPRRVGKTTLLKKYLTETKFKYKSESGDNIKIQNLLSSKETDRILEYIEGYELLAIDEAQQIKGIGSALKILVDNRPDLKIIATGSSSFDLSQEVGEPLTGRKKTITLLPFSQKELLSKYNKYELKEKLEEFLIYGLYPEVVLAKSKKGKIETLSELVNSYLLKDVLSYEHIKNSQLLFDLLKMLAYQTGQLVSENELAVKLKVNVRTISRYLDLLEKSFVIFRLTAYSRNIRNEIAKKSKFYFFDNGIRNGIISQFNSLDLRNDIGQLWENFMITERTKKNEYKGFYGKSYFWRNYNQQEIDFIEEKDGILFVYEMKWNKTKVKLPGDFKSKYPDAKFKVINQSNYLDFIL